MAVLGPLLARARVHPHSGTCTHTHTQDSSSSSEDEGGRSQPHASSSLTGSFLSPVPSPGHEHEGHEAHEAGEAYPDPGDVDPGDVPHLPAKQGKGAPRKRAVCLIDEVLELTHADMVANRAGMDAHLEGLAATRARKHREQQGRAELARLLEYHPVQDLQGVVGRRLRALHEQLGRRLPPSPVSARARRGGGRGARGQLAAAAAATRFQDEEAGADTSFGDSSTDLPLPAAQDLSSHTADTSVEVELAREAARLSDIMPWHRDAAGQRVGAASLPGTPSSSRDARSSLLQGLDAWSLDWGGGGSRHSGAASPLARLSGGGEGDLLFGGGGDGAAGDAIPPGSMDKDTIDFYRWVLCASARVRACVLHGTFCTGRARHPLFRGLTLHAPAPSRTTTAPAT